MKLANIMFAAAAVAVAPSAALAATVYDSAPTAGWYFNSSSSNNYSPAHTAVLTTTSDSGTDQVFLRAHATGQLAPDSPDGTYYFSSSDFTPANLNGSGGRSLSIDFGFTSATGSSGITGILTVQDVAKGTTATLPMSFLPDNYGSNGTLENSERLSYPFLLGTGANGFDPTLDDTYLISFSVNGLASAPNGETLNITAQVGSGAAAVPEPASWAMMVGGFGLMGAALRRRKAALRFA